MTLVDLPQTSEQRFLASTNWEGYLHVLRAFEGVRVRITFDRGKLELLTTSPQHEEIKKFLGQLLEAALLEWDRNYKPAGSTTFRREMLERGLEPDECYYLTVLPQFTAGADPEVLPAPDLAIEVEVTRSALDRMEIYRALGVSEVWRYSVDHRLRVEVLGPNGYRTLERSSILPNLPLNELPSFVRLGVEQGSIPMLRQFRVWLNTLSLT